MMVSKDKIKDNKGVAPKEKINELLIYLAVIIVIIGVFSVSYYIGYSKGNTSDIPVGQEYRLKDVIMGSNSTFTVVYYDNDEKHTEKAMIPTAYNNFNFTQSNSTIAVLKLERVNNGVNYWNIYIPNEEKKGGINATQK